MSYQRPAGGRLFPIRSTSQRLASLEHYLLVNQDEARIEHFRRNPDGTWTLSNAVAGGAVRLPDLGGDLAVDEIYLAMEFTRS